VLRQHDLPAVVTHHNSPRHTVIACGLDQVKALQAALNAAGLASLKIPVPAAFHTPMMADAENVFRHATAEEAIRPPVCGFLSATTAEYAAEPDAVRRSLVTQLTKPVLYEPTVRRLLRDGCGLLIEIGPNDVLTRLNREIIGDTAVCLSLDLPGSSFSERIALAELAMECVTARSSHAAVLRTSPSAPQPRTATPLVESQPTDDVEMFDVRARARRLEETSQAADRSQPVTDVDAAETSTVFAEEASDDVETTSDLAPEAVYEFLTNLLVELTGYSPEVIDLDADLEADLGLDSIKKAQMIGELSEWAGLAIAPSQVRLGSLSNLRQIAALAQGVAIVETAARSKTSRPSQARESQPAAAPVMQDAAPSLDAAAVEQLLVDFVIDQTGYSREIIDLDADLEADLGVDSIKRAQLLGEMHEQFNLTGLSLERTSLNRFPTLRSIRDFLLQELGDDGGDESVSESPATTPRRDFAPAPPPPRRAKPQRQPAPAAASSSIVLGVEPHDEIPDAWRTLFDLNALADDPAAIRENQQRRGQEHRHEIRAALRLQIATEQETGPATTLDAVSTSALEGLAAGAGVSVAAVRATHQTLFPTRQAPPSPLGEGSESPPRKSPQNSVPSPSETSTHDHASSAAGRTRRFTLRMIPAPRREGTPTKFELKGPVLILGENPIATAIKERVQAEGGRAIRFGSSTAPGDVATRLEELWKSGGVTPHLFLTSPHDDDSLREINAAHWQRRRNAGVQTPFRICQLWMERMIAEGRMDEGSVVAVANLGGDFGFSGHGVTSPEGGGIGGLLKAMVIESWMRGFRNTPMKVVDIAPETSPRDAVEGLWRELATPSYDMEVEVCGENRRTVQAVAAPLDETSRSRNAPQGAWILSGGGRGITAITGMALAERYNLTLHLLGTAAVPEVTPAMRAAAKADRSQLRREIMRAASDVGENAIEAWRDAEKAIEIDATLQECRERGLRATYHCCDVSDAGDVKGTLEAIRRQDGPIRGVIHGAGAGQDARFDRKRPDKVDKCIRAKVDGCLTLMSATEDDPLDWFVTFGSISGRFGANGHTDYSLANDMLAKIVDLYRRERPDVASLTFHWHAWGDVGMATKPEARLALEMIDLEFMPAADGLAHFLREFEFGGEEPEVLITDHKYYRKFFPAERITDTTAAETVNPFPLLSSPNAEQGSGQAHLDPVRDLFLAQHLVNGRPTLPFVVALELMAEGARSAAGDHPVRSCRNLEALQALKFATDEPLDVSIARQSSPPRIGEDYPRLVRCALRADLRQRNGRLVEAGREYFRGEFLIGEPEEFERTPWPDLTDLEWRPIEYQGPEAPVYHGPELRSLRRFAIAGETSFGRIGASASVQLFGGNRPARGWTVSCDTMDACLYACALHAWNRQRKPSLPVRFDEITFGRLPDPGEPCLVRIEEHGADESGMDFSFRLWGQNGDVLLDVQGYRVAWLHL
jgi:malonyl CoA-acyl carrier protein transacylase